MALSFTLDHPDRTMGKTIDGGKDHTKLASPGTLATYRDIRPPSGVLQFTVMPLRECCRGCVVVVPVAASLTVTFGVLYASTSAVARRFQILPRRLTLGTD